MFKSILTGALLLAHILTEALMGDSLLEVPSGSLAGN